MTTRKIGDRVMVEFESREEALAYAEAKRNYQELWMMIVQAEMNGLLSAN